MEDLWYDEARFSYLTELRFFCFVYEHTITHISLAFLAAQLDDGGMEELMNGGSEQLNDFPHMEQALKPNFVRYLFAAKF